MLCPLLSSLDHLSLVYGALGQCISTHLPIYLDVCMTLFFCTPLITEHISLVLN